MAEPQPEAPPSPRPNIKGEYKTPAAPKPATCDLHDVAKDNNDPPPQKSALLLMVVVPAVVALYACLVAAGRALSLIHI